MTLDTPHTLTAHDTQHTAHATHADRTRHTTHTRFQKWEDMHNHQLLFHGSHLANFVGTEPTNTTSSATCALANHTHRT